MSRGRGSCVLWVLLAVYLPMALGYSLVTPVLEGPDEEGHFRYVDYLARARRLPDLRNLPSCGSHECAQGPAYYLAAAVLVSWIDRSDLDHVIRRNPDADMVELTGRLLNEIEGGRRVPPRGSVMAIRISRLLSLCFGAATVVLTCRAGSTLLPQGGLLEEVPLLSAGLLATSPKFLSMSGLVSNDTMACCAGALSLLLMGRMVRGGAPTRRGAFVLGCAVGLAGLVKYSGFALAVPGGIMLLAGQACAPRGRSGSSWPGVVALAAWYGAGILATAGWFLTWNLVRYGHPLAWAQVLEANAPLARPTGLGVAEFVRMLPRLASTLWDGFGYGAHHPPRVQALLRLLPLPALVGLVIAVARKPVRAALGVPSLLVLACVAAFFSWWKKMSATEDVRLLAPALPSMSLLASVGVRSLVPSRIPGPARSLAVGLVLALSLAFSVYTVTHLLAWTYAEPTYLPEGEIAPMREAGQVVRFENGLDLIHARVTSRTTPRGQELLVQLTWQATREIEANYWITVAAIDARGDTVGRFFGLPFDGRLATTNLRPGGAFTDVVRLGLNRVPSDGARVVLGWCPYRSPGTFSRVVGTEETFVELGELGFGPS